MTRDHDPVESPLYFARAALAGFARGVSPGAMDRVKPNASAASANTINPTASIVFVTDI
jgi:hypothetical protein